MQVNFCKFFGVYIDNHLTGKDHITKISQKYLREMEYLPNSSFNTTDRFTKLILFL